MNNSVDEKLIVQRQIATLINEGLEEIDSGSEGEDSSTFFSQMKEKYGK